MTANEIPAWAGVVIILAFLAFVAFVVWVVYR